MNNYSNGLDNNYNNLNQNNLNNMLPKDNINNFNMPINTTSNNMLNNGNFYREIMGGADQLGQISNNNLVDIANSIDHITLNGTNLDDLDNNKVYNQRKKNDDNTSLIKTITKEIIHNLKDKNLELNDISNGDDLSNYSSKSSSKKKNKKIKESIEDFVTSENPIPSTNNYFKSLFNNYFNIKDFLILFILYFILSQEMIKDFFAKYFSSLNPDDEGKINVQGVIVYGLILTVLFMIIRKLF